MKIFKIQGATIGFHGTAIGVSLGCLIAWSIPWLVPMIEHLLGVQFLPPSVYFISELPSELVHCRRHADFGLYRGIDYCVIARDALSELAAAQCCSARRRRCAMSDTAMSDTTAYHMCSKTPGDFRRPSCRAASTSRCWITRNCRSAAARSWRSSGRRGRARARCFMCSAVSMNPAPARFHCWASRSPHCVNASATTCAIARSVSCTNSITCCLNSLRSIMSPCRCAFAA